MKIISALSSRRALLFTMLSLPSFGIAATFSANDIVYDSDNPTVGEATVIGYNGAGGAVTIPANVSDGVNSYDVTVIMFYAFNNANLTSISIPDGITSIGEYAFEGNQLTSITIPDSVTFIDYLAFTSNNLTDVTISNSLTIIGEQIFAYNELTSVTIPDSVISIQEAAFYDNDLTSVTIPENVANIYDFAFANNPNLVEVWFDADAPSITSAGVDGSFGEAAGKTLYYDCTNTTFTLDTNSNPPTWQGYDVGMYCFTTFDSQGGSPVPNEKVIVGNTVTEPTPPTRTDYTFSGWFSDPAATMPYDFNTTQSDPLTLYAGWTQNAPTTTPKAIPSLSAWALALLTGIILLIARAIYRRQS